MKTEGQAPPPSNLSHSTYRIPITTAVRAKNHLSAGLLLFLSVAFAGGQVVTGPPGLGFVGTLPVAPLSPLLEQMPLKNRLDMSVIFTNASTNGPRTFTGGTLTLRGPTGAAIIAAPLSGPEFVKRRSLSTGGTFATGPLLMTFPSHQNATLTGLAWTPLGGLVAAGWGAKTNDGSHQFIAVRMLLDGTLDTSFDGNGAKAGAAGDANAIALQSDGKIVLAGTSDGDFRVQRFNVDGSEDSTFGAAGTRTTSLPATATALAVGIDAQGRIVVAGRVQNGQVWNLALVRHLTNGALDTTFGHSGIVITDVAGATTESIAALVIDSSNRPVVAGSGLVGGNLQMLVARYTTSGALDATFGGNGVVLSSFTGADFVEARAIAIDGAKRIVIGGAATVGGASKFALARLTAAGAFDATFDGDGQVVTAFTGASDAMIMGLAIGGSDSIHSAGHARLTEADYLAIARHDANGALVPAFASGGKLKVPLEDDDALAEVAYARSIIPLPLGDFLVGGTALIDNVSRWAIARFHDDGSPYTTATVPAGAQVTLQLADFPFFTDVAEGFDGFDPKATPARLDVELNFQGLAEPFRITGIPLRLWTQNPSPFRFPLHDPTVFGTKWVASGGHERGTPHGNIKAQRFHWDIHAETNGSSVVPGIDPADFQDFWAGHPSGNYDSSRDYTAGELPNCQIAWGQPVYAMAAGTVIRSFTNQEDNFPNGDKTFGDGAGNSCVIDHGNGQYGVYAHMQKGSVLVAKGSNVIAGQKLGLVGNSGNSSGPHLHVGLVDAPGATSWSDAQSMPLYFIDALFATASGGPVVRQLRAAPRDGEIITIDPSPVPFASPGTTYGPGLVAEILAPHDSITTPQRLVPPVSVQGSIASTPGTAMADGGDVIEDVYRFNVTQPSTVWVRLEFPAGHDLDVLLYNSALQAVQPDAGKTLARPETFYATVPADVYYLFVSRYDPSGNAPVNYTLHMGVYANGRPIYVDWEGLCPVPFGNPVCGGGWGGPYATVHDGYDVAFPGCAMFIRGNHSYPEAIVLRTPMLIRSYNGKAVINP